MAGNVLTALEPRPVWELFEEITRVPRCSGKEERIRRWVLEWAKRKMITARTDRTGNVLLSVPATAGCFDYPTLTVQAHLDMVCASDSSVSFDFDKDRFRFRVDGGTVRAQGTTLGADNGIGIALALAILADAELSHGALEALFTVNEENGFIGAFGIKPGFFTGSCLINLDSEDLGQVTVGSAGGEFIDYNVTIGFQEADDEVALELAVDGLQSGHSGIQIHLPRLNAIKLLLQGLQSLPREVPLRLCRFDGGTASNAIAPAARCAFLVPTERKAMALGLLGQWKERTLGDGRSKEPGMRIEVTEAPDKRGWEKNQTAQFLELLDEVPQGPLAFSEEIEGLVETSNNLGVVRTKDDAVEVLLNCRSSVNRELETLGERLRRIGERHGAQVRPHDRYPGWSADPASPFSRFVTRHYEEVLGRAVEVTAYHAGLECGVFKSIRPGLQIVSIGPTLRKVHSPGEEVDIASVGTIWEVLRRVVSGLDGLKESGD
jgi:dipeptidase D